MSDSSVSCYDSDRFEFIGEKVQATEDEADDTSSESSSDDSENDDEVYWSDEDDEIEDEEDDDSDESESEDDDGISEKGRSAVLDNVADFIESERKATNKASTEKSRQSLKDPTIAQERVESTYKPTYKSRKNNTLAILTSRFIAILRKSKNHTVEISQVADQMNVKKRRLYDVANVLEGCKLIEKTSRNRIRWAGVFPIDNVAVTSPKTLAEPESRATNTRKRRRITEVELHHSVSLQRTARHLDTAIALIQSSIAELTAKANLTGEQLRAINYPMSTPDAQQNIETNLIAVHIPSEKSIVKIHVPFYDSVAGCMLHQIHFESKSTTANSSISAKYIDKEGQVVHIEPPSIPSIPQLPVSACGLFLSDSQISNSQQIHLSQDISNQHFSFSQETDLSL